MKPLSIVLYMSLAIAIVVFLMFGVVLQMIILAPLILGIFSIIELGIASIFFYGSEKKMGFAFLLGFGILALSALSVYGYIWIYMPKEFQILTEYGG